jgi:hypothetical protein
VAIRYLLAAALKAMFLTIAAWLGTMPLSKAAEIRGRHGSQGELSIIAVVGELDVSDGEKFANVASQFPHAVVAFNSPGGALIAGLQIGKVIRLHHFPTIVSNGFACASACAVAWLAGTPMLMQQGSRIGFHAAFNEQAGIKVGSNVGNALVGAYMSEMGLSYAAIGELEEAAPDDIKWLTIEDAHRLGLDFRLLPPSAETGSPPDRPTREPERPGRTENAPTRSGRWDRADSLIDPDFQAPQAPDPAPRRSVDQRAQDFANQYFAHWSESGIEAIRYFEGVYANRVIFYGHSVDRNSVLEGKRGFTKRWPARIYSMRPGTVRAFCNPDTQTCTISGVVDWDCRNAAGDAATKGAANFTMTVIMRDGKPEILAEGGTVIARTSD